MSVVLQSRTPTQLAETARRAAAETGFWRPRVRFDAAERYYARLEVTDDYEVWLLTWLPGQGTGIHDHGGSSGAFTVVQGELTERTFTAAPTRPSPWALPAGAIRAFGPRHTHEVVNHGAVPAVSVHAYSPALTSMSYYEELPGGGVVLRSTSPVDR
ncbi:cysteine dioxygenase [Streptomyces sp. A7024]|uniref:Cysteine dioxygenase n=1 Tax=Streptomyces coryli TaxID=1128680 RepID=A0A6G4U244_9ACTN|nr:cysteine dioxygenase family protein [Streptomyces coryli]NGN66224.1 cysteine dioxygenase [Streptomyces coryli]